MDSPKSASKSSDTLRLHGELPVKGSQQRPSGGGGSESKMADLRLGEPKMADLRLSESKMADLRLGDISKTTEMGLSESKMADLRLSESKMADLRLSESKMADSPDSSVLSSSRRSLLSLDGRRRGSFIKQENKENKKEEEEEDEKEVEERLGRLLGLVTSEPPVIRSCNYTAHYFARTTVNLKTKRS
jgi:hypothetical protein